MKNPVLKSAYTFLACTLSCLILSACGPLVNTTVSHNKYEPLDKEAPVVVLSETDPVPANAEAIGQTSIINSALGVSPRSTYAVAVEKAKTEARNSGGNLVKITKLITKTKDQDKVELYADIMHIPDNSMLLESATISDDSLANINFAKIYFFRPVAGMVNYDLYLNDSKIASTHDNWKAEVKIEAMPDAKIWGQTESKQTLTIDLEPGGIYFIRCGLKMGDNIGVPFFEVVDREEGIKYYNAIP